MDPPLGYGASEGKNVCLDVRSYRLDIFIDDLDGAFFRSQGCDGGKR
jgi:hypothetical protein